MGRDDRDESAVNLYERRYEGRCHLCQFVRENPEMGELLEARILDRLTDDQEVANYFNDRFDFFKEKKGSHSKLLDLKKIRTHKAKHLSNHQEIYARAQQKGLTGNITLERSVMDQLTVLEALEDAGSNRVAQGDIKVDSLSDLLRVYEYKSKLLGGDKIEIKVGGQGGLNIPPQLLTSIVGVMQRFVSPHQQVEFRQALDSEVFPEFRRYAEQYEESTGRPFDAKPELPQGTNPDIIEGSETDGLDDRRNGHE